MMWFVIVLIPIRGNMHIQNKSKILENEVERAGGRHGERQLEE